MLLLETETDIYPCGQGLEVYFLAVENVINIHITRGVNVYIHIGIFIDGEVLVFGAPFAGFHADRNNLVRDGAEYIERYELHAYLVIQKNQGAGGGEAVVTVYFQMGYRIDGEGKTEVHAKVKLVHAQVEFIQVYGEVAVRRSPLLFPLSLVASSVILPYLA